MAKSGTLPLPDEIKFLQYGHLNSHHQVYDPNIAECKTDGPVARLNCGNSCDWGSKIGAQPQENLRSFCPGEKDGAKSDSVNNIVGFKFGCLKLSDSSVLIHCKDGVAMDLVGKEDQGPDLEAGREMYGGGGDGGGGGGGGGTFWGSARKFFGNAFDRLMAGDYGQSFDESIDEAKRMQPTLCSNANLDMGKLAAENPESKVAIPKSKCKNGENQRATKLNENGGRHIKHSNKKPPRPPRPPRPPKETIDPSQEHLMRAMLRRAKLERITHLKEKQIAKPKSSNLSAWALAFTFCLCFVLVFQGVFSQGNSSVKMSPEAVQESTFSVYKYVNHAINDGPLHPVKQGEASGNLYSVEYPMDKAGFRSRESDRES